MSGPVDLAIVGNGRIAALINSNGRLVWWCFPRFDSDPVFCRLIAGDEEKGFCDVLLDRQVDAQSHCPGESWAFHPADLFGESESCAPQA